MVPHGVSVRVAAGYLAGIVLGTMSITLLFLGMRAVMDVGGACADGGPYVSAQPCPSGVPIAMIGGMFGLFGATGLIVWFGSRIGAAATAVIALGWPALFLALGFNFLDYAFRPPDSEATPVWGWLVPGVLFWLLGGAPLAVGIAAWREARTGRPTNRLVRQVITSAAGSAPSAFGARAAATTAEPSAARVEFAPDSWGAPRSAQPARIGRARADPADGRDAEIEDIVDDLVRLADLHAAGELTDEEFSTAKRERLEEAERQP